MIRPEPAPCPDWPKLEKLNREKEVIGIYLSSHPLDNFKLEINQFCTHTLAEMRDLESLRGKDVTIAGMITAVKHSTTRNGKPYGTFTIEDYSDTMSITLFNKDYENFRKFLYDGYSLLLKGMVTENTWKNNPELEFRIKSMHMLSSAREELVKTIQIRLPIDRLTDSFIEDFTKCTSRNPGNTNLKIMVYDPSENISVDFFSRSHRISLDDDLIEFLTENKEIDFKLL
jgi:DNA polymerase-3 subunit alpha